MDQDDDTKFERAVWMLIHRYSNQEVLRVNGKAINMRNDWTPAQKRSMRRAYRKLLKASGRTSLGYPDFMT